MGTSFFTIQFDITPPEIEIISPSYTTQYTLTEIRIQANKRLDQFQEIYIIDSTGVRHDISFLYSETEYTGHVSFNNYPLGVATIYARLSDDVGNISELASKPINIIESIYLRMKPNVSAMKCVSEVRTMVIKSGLKTMKQSPSVKELK